MVDDTNKTDQSNEQSYEFSEEKSSEFGGAPHSSGTEHIMSLLKNTRVMYAIGGVVGLYILMSLFSTSDEIEPVEISEPAAPQVQQSTESDLEPVQQSTVSSFESMLGESSEKDEEMDKLKKSVASLNRQYADYRTRLQDLDKKVDDLNVTLNRATTQLSKLIDKDLAKTNTKKEVVLQEYRIKAVISGRAWLEDRNGQNITVKVGDKLPTYGRITEIKPIEGIVNTSSGRVISFEATQ